MQLELPGHVIAALIQRDEVDAAGDEIAIARVMHDCECFRGNSAYDMLVAIAKPKEIFMTDEDHGQKRPHTENLVDFPKNYVPPTTKPGSSQVGGDGVAGSYVPPTTGSSPSPTPPIPTKR